MAEVQLRTLRVSAELDPSAYKAGMDTKIAADKAGAASSAQVGAAISQTDQKISQSGDVLQRLSRTYVDGYASAQRFQSAIDSLTKGVEGGKIAMTQASSILDGIYRKYNMTADASALAARGQIELAAAVERANAKLLAQASIQPAAFDTTALRAAQTGANFSNDLNSSLGIGSQSASARASASVFEEAAREAERYAQQAAAVRAAIDPVGASQARLNAEIAEYTVLLNRAEISTTEFAQAETLARTRHEQFAASLNKTPVAGNDNNAQFRRQNLGYQMFDVAQMQALGQNPMMTLMQQGPQIAQLYAGNGGLKAAMSDVAAIAGGIVSSIGAVPLALGAAGVAAIAYFTMSGEKAKTVDELIKQQIASLQSLGNAYGNVAAKATEAANAGNLNNFGITSSSSVNGLNLGVTTATTEALSKILIDRGGGGSGNQFGPAKVVEGEFAAFSKAIDGLRNSAIKGVPDILTFRKQVEDRWAMEPNNAELTKAAALLLEYTANAAAGAKAIRELEAAQRALFNNVGPGGFLLSRGTTNREDSGNLAAFQEQQRIAAERSRAAFNAQIESINARSPEEKAAAARSAAAAQYNETETPAVRSERIELAGKQALIAAEHDLRIAQEERVRASDAALASAQNELSLVGQSVAERNRLRAAYEAEAQIRQAAAAAGVRADEQEIAAARAKASALADINAQISARKLLEDQGYQIEQLQLEARLIGASADERARATAALQAEQQLRQQGISLLSQEGQQYIANAQAMAAARAEIERQNAAFSSMQQTGTSALSSLITGTGSFKDRLKAALDTTLTWIQQMTLVNPLSNSLFKTNLPTMGDLFSGRPAVPGMQSTATMTVTAGTVMVNGGVTGALSGAFPSSPTGGTLSGFLGLPTPANSNIANGVRPDLMANGIVNSPVSALTPADPASRAMMWRQGISQIESGSYEGNYSALGPITRNGDRAYGRYQVMGNNVPSWSEKYYGEKLTPQQYLQNSSAQDAVFDGEFGSYVSKYGEGPAANKWFTGSHVARGATDVNGMSDSRYSQQFTSNMQKLSQTTASTSKDLGTLGDTSSKVGTQITDGLGKLATPAAVPAVPAPATATSGSNPFASLFGGFFKLLGFADGTDYSPGGSFMVGERGREIVNLPRGSQVVPNHKMALGKNFEGMGTVRHEYNINVSGNGDKELMARMQSVAETTVRGGLSEYDAVLPERIERYRQNPYNRGGI